VEPAALITLTLVLEPTVWPSATAKDIAFRMRLTNRSDRKLELYPDAAKLSQEGGWTGPIWQVVIRGAGSTREAPVKHIRTYYGPPGMPPAASYFKSFRKKIKQRETIEARLQACFLPNAMLRPEHLAAAKLDPDGADGIRNTDRPPPELPPQLKNDPRVIEALKPLEERISLASASVLVFGKSCADLDRERATRADFLRPGIVAFLPGAGAYEVEVSYAQPESPGSGLQAGKALIATSPPVAVTLQGR
jgi:hypothetical protein